MAFGLLLFLCVFLLISFSLQCDFFMRQTKKRMTKRGRWKRWKNAQFHMPAEAMGQRVHEWRIEVESVNKIRRVNLQNVKSSLLAFFYMKITQESAWREKMR